MSSVGKLLAINLDFSLILEKLYLFQNLGLGNAIVKRLGDDRIDQKTRKLALWFSLSDPVLRLD